MIAAIAGPITANERFKRRAGAWVWKAMILSAALHFAMFAFGPRMGVAFDVDRPEPTVVVDLPDHVPLPPAPPEIVRPVAPVIAVDAPTEVTMPETSFDRYRPEMLAPPPVATSGDVLSGYTAFTPSMVAPRLLNPREVERALRQLYPPVLLDAGIGGTVQVLLWVDEAGAIARAQIAAPSGYEAMDRAALDVVEVMRVSPARNRGKPVRVLVAIPLTFRSR